MHFAESVSSASMLLKSTRRFETSCTSLSSSRMMRFLSSGAAGRLVEVPLRSLAVRVLEANLLQGEEVAGRAEHTVACRPRRARGIAVC